MKGKNKICFDNWTDTNPQLLLLKCSMLLVSIPNRAPGSRSVGPESCPRKSVDVENRSDDGVAETEDLGRVAKVVRGALEEEDCRVEVLEVWRGLDLQSRVVFLLDVDSF